MNPKYLVYENPKYDAFIRSKPCLICGRGPVDLHHSRHARKMCYLGLPLCREHHTFGKDAYHVLEHQAFEEAHNLDLDWEAIKLLSEYIDSISSSEEV